MLLRASSCLQTTHRRLLQVLAVRLSFSSSGQNFTILAKIVANRRAWTGAPAPPVETELRDSRDSATFLTVGLTWEEVFSYRFRTPRHINVLQLEALISLVQRLADRGTTPFGLLVLVDSRGVLGAFSKGRSSSEQVNLFPARSTWWAPPRPSLNLVWVPTWRNLASAPSRC